MRFAGSAFRSAHGLDLLGDVLPVHLVVYPLTRASAPQQRRLVLGPQQDVGVVFAHHPSLITSRAKYDRIRSAPARLNAPSVSRTTTCSFSAPAAAANLIIAYSPLT